MLNASQICRCQDLFLLQKMTIKMQNTYNFVCVCFFFLVLERKPLLTSEL